jgi:uncharacterized protein (DUF362 family)/ferredoxin
MSLPGGVSDMHKVLVLDADYDNVYSALDRILDEFPVDVAGKRVLLKPNMLGAFAPETHVCTSPRVIEPLVERLRASGGEVTVADNPGARGYGFVEKSGKVSGILEAAGGTFANISSDVEAVRLPGLGITVNVSKAILESDVLISVPKFKTHVLTRISGAVKNSFGFMVGGDKARMHRELTGQEFSRMLVEVYRLKVPDLVIMDGIVGMEGNGPSAKTLYPVGKILASDNGVALDAVMTRMMRMRPEKMAMLRYARELGLGEIDSSKIRVIGDGGPLSRFRKPVPNLQQVIPVALMDMLYPDLDRPRFEVNSDACNSCKGCADICPGCAIEMVDGRPTYDYEKCIACYCCMELCSQQAIDLVDSFRIKVYRKLGLM